MGDEVIIRWELKTAVRRTDPIRWGRNYHKLRIKTAISRTDYPYDGN